MARTRTPRRSQPPWLTTLSASIPVRLALLALLATLAYGASLSSGVAWDDAEQLSANPAIRSLEQPWRFFTDPQTATPFGGAFMSQYRPLRTLLFALEFGAAVYVQRVSGTGLGPGHGSRSIKHVIGTVMDKEYPSFFTFGGEVPYPFGVYPEGIPGILLSFIHKIICSAIDDHVRLMG
jgi:hypothetical protein